MPRIINGYRAEGFDDGDEPFDYEAYQRDAGNETCGHIAQVSISTGEIQCMDCLRKWPKPADFKSDFPEYDRG